MHGQNVLFDAEERVGQELERVRQEKILERIEFEKQIERFTQKELLKAIQKREALKANKEYWNQQVEWNRAKKVQHREIEDSAGIQPTFLKKMFKYQELLDLNAEEDIESKMPRGEVTLSRQQRSRMHYNKDDVQQDVLQQIENNAIKKQIEKLKDLEIGQVMAEKAERNLAGEEEFRKVKKLKGKEVMKKQWDEQLKLKTNESLVHRIFV